MRIADLQPIQTLLTQNPELTTIEDVISHCKDDGIEADLWHVYFAARRVGRHLQRRLPRPFDEKDLRELAVIFLGLHIGRKQALQTLDTLGEINKEGKQISWQTEHSSTQYGWEMSVAQELVDAVGSVPKARELLGQL